MKMEHVVLNNRVKIPKIGFGTWQIPAGEEAYEATMEALKAGYRHIDTAAAYRNEVSIGKAIRDSGIPRDQLFVTSKLAADKKGYDIAKEEFQATLDRLGFEYLDLYLIHWPKPWGVEGDGYEYNDQNVETWKAFVDLQKEGKIRAIGVSNFKPGHLKPLLKASDVLPQVNQIFLAPGQLQKETVAFCEERNILLEAYSPLGTGRIFEVDELQDIAKRYGKSVSQLAIRWSLQKGFLPLPKSATPSHIKENLDVFDFAISESDIKKIDDVKLPPR